MTVVSYVVTMSVMAVLTYNRSEIHGLAENNALSHADRTGFVIIYDLWRNFRRTNFSTRSPYTHRYTKYII